MSQNIPWWWKWRRGILSASWCHRRRAWHRPIAWLLMPWQSSRRRRRRCEGGGVPAGSGRGGDFCGFPPCYQVPAPAADKHRMCHTPADITLSYICCDKRWIFVSLIKFWSQCNDESLVDDEIHDLLYTSWYQVPEVCWLISAMTCATDPTPPPPPIPHIIAT